MVFTQALGFPRKKHTLRGRRLVVVDIENMVGGAVMTVEQASEACLSLRRAAGLKGDEQVIIGTSHNGAMSAWLGWQGPRPRLVVRSGQDGADLELLEVLTHERIAERFDEVILASGDGIFTAAVAALAAAGVAVTVIARPGKCSKRLSMAATRTFLLEPLDLNIIGGAA